MTHPPAAAAPAAPGALDLATLQSLLIVRLRNLGDCVLMTPVLEALRRWRSTLAITVLVERRFAAVFSGNPYLTDLEEVETDGPPWQVHRHRLKALRRVQVRPFDLVWNLHGGPTSLLFSMAPACGAVLGFEHYRQAHRYTLRAPDPALVWNRGPVHTVETQLAPLKWLGVPFDLEGLNPRVYTGADADRLVAGFLARHGLAGRPFVLLQPTATLRTKQWPERNYSRLIDRIHHALGLQAVVAAGPGEEPVARRVASGAARSAPVFCGRGLEELKSLMARAGYYIGNDSGPMHLAAALKRPLVCIFGSSNHAAWRPWGTDCETVRADLPCVPCPGYRCYEFDEPRCIEGIGVDAVFAAFRRLVERHPC